MSEESPRIPRTCLDDGLVVASINHNETRNLYQEIFEDRVYLPPAGFRLPARPVVLDVGANIGLFSVFAAREWSGARIHAFEPVPQVYRVLAENLRGLPDATPHELAVGKSDGHVTITHYPGFTMMSGIGADRERDLATVRTYVANVTAEDEASEAIAKDIAVLLAPRFEQVRIPVPVSPLASVLPRLGIDRIDLLKVDVEGSELDVMLGLDEPAWSVLHNAVVEIDDRTDELDRIRRLCHCHGMTTSVTQLPEYRGTDLHILYAWRDS